MPTVRIRCCAPALMLVSGKNNGAKMAEYFASNPDVDRDRTIIYIMRCDKADKEAIAR
jgi:hypothetical protein